MIVLFFSVGSYYLSSVSSLKNEIISVQLGRIANYIGSDIIDLVSLCYTTNLDQLLIKQLNLPKGLTAYAYDLSLEKIGQSMVVRAYLISDSNIYGEFVLPFSIEGNIKLYNGSDSQIENFILSENPSLNPELEIYSRDANAVVWCAKIGGNITIGLGIIQEGGG